MDPLKIPRKTVISSNITSIGYDQPTRTLTIEFKTKAIYSYHPITEEAHKELMDADSQGTYFTEKIRNNPNVTTKCIKDKPKK